MGKSEEVGKSETLALEEVLGEAAPLALATLALADCEASLALGKGETLPLEEVLGEA